MGNARAGDKFLLINFTINIDRSSFSFSMKSMKYP